MTKLTLFLAALAVPFLALAQEVSPDASTEVLITAIFTAIRDGQIGLAVVVALMLVVAIVRKSLAPKVAFLQTDVGGTLLGFVSVVLIMLAGPVSAGGALTFALVKTAVLTAFATSGGFTFVKRTLLTPLILANADKIYAAVEKLPGGFFLKLIVRVLIGKYLTPAPAKAPAPAAPAPVLAAVPGSNVATSSDRPAGDI